MRRSASFIPDLLLRVGVMVGLWAAAPALAQGGETAEGLRPPAPDSAAADKPAISGPSGIPEPSHTMRRRAFEAMRQKGRFPAIEARARKDREDAAQRLAAEHDAVQKRLYEALGLAAPIDAAKPRDGRAGALAKNWVPMLFASSSLPLQTLRNYAAQLETVGGVIAFRGVPGGMSKIGPMAKLTAQILRVDPGCEGPACTMRNVQLIVDPILFRQHGVNQVPAFAMAPGDPTLPYCERDDEIGPSASHIVYGDAALSGLLEEYARLGGKQEVSDAASRLSRR
ncbi:type-F conjugative transfer system pilin assembly protein TrbC [Sphingobium sp. JS3065]|uniref:type-F conjugative transfer system pilin assembly protein TrbC n=1 Tax=Sphingobium sp. JS3065 TaxID=2970925 RepID=UPI0022643E81|nr:type-F conjugative transfer system pilin assembly protein TrbC [Sphingobium sp. JS3065]UZW57692.1 type-F conjugative transfer system pilin assembly protein TrbC [Sphingobium sp. JS3065]